MKIFLIVLLALAAAACLVWSAISFYALKLNEELSAYVPVTPPTATRASEPPDVLIQIVDKSTYVVAGRRHDLASLAKVLVKDGRPVGSVAVHVLTQNDFSATVALMNELRRLEIPKVSLEPAPAAASDAEYAALTRRILDRIGTLQGGPDAVDWAAEIKRAVVRPDGAGGFAIEHNLTWVLDDPAKPASKLNARRPEYGPGGFWIDLTFYRGAWGGAAAFASIDFDDLHLWFNYGYKDDATAIGLINRIVEEERAAFEKRPR